MIKNFLSSILLLICASNFTAVAKDTYYRNSTILPTTAQSAISENFIADVSMVKIDRNLGKIADYNVILTDGTTMRFDPTGSWDIVEVGIDGNVPEFFIPDTIIGYMEDNFEEFRVIGVERDRNEYKLVLSDGRELKFNRHELMR